MPENDHDETLKDRTVPLHELSQRKVPRTFGGYELRGELGRGGMGVVYRAHQLTLKRMVALKMLTGDYAADDVLRFRAEAEMAAGLQHPNIVHIHEVGEEDGVPFFSMEFVEGGTLGDLLLRGLPEPKAAAEMMMTLARAMHYAHRQGVVHRDMKPGNVLIGSQGEIKIADFGIAKRLDGESSMTLSGAVMGTPVYMAPEQAGGQSRKVGPAADVYALGALFYHLLTGRPPFLPDESDTALTLRVLQEDPVSPAWHRPEVPRDLETICLKALQKEPADRYSSADAMAEDLRRYLGDEPILAHPPTKIVRTVKWVKRHPMRLTLWLLLAAVTGAGVQWLWQWEFYERPHVTWAWSLEATHGMLEPKLAISEMESKSLATSYRLTRRGRHGPVTSVELLNARGYPATARRIVGGDFLPNWLEGVGGAQNPDERAQETVKIEYAFSGDDLREVVGLDRNRHMTWRMIPEIKSDARSARVRFVNAFGFDADAHRYATNAEFDRNAAGKDVAVRFLTSSGIPAMNREGVYGYKLERDSQERVVALTNLGRDGQPAPNFNQVVAAAYTWNDEGRVTRQEFQDGKGGRLPWNGVTAIQSDFDKRGNLLRLHWLDTEDKPTNGMPEGCGLLENERNERGEISAVCLYKVQPDGTRKPVAKTSIIYEERGYPTETTFTGTNVSRMKFLYDERGNVTEEQVMDADGKLRLNADNWALKRSTYADDKDGRCWRLGTTFFNESGERAWCKGGGHHRELITYDLSGQLRELDTYDHDPERYDFYRYTSRPEYNNEGRTVRLVARFEDKNGRMMAGPWTHGSAETEFDAAGNPVIEWKLGCDSATMGGPVIRTEKKWDADRRMTRKVVEICDEKRQPVAVTVNDEIPAWVEEDYKGGQLVREWKFGYRPEVHGAESWRTDIEWVSKDFMKHRVREAYDSGRQAVAMITDGNPARTEEIYNDLEQLEKLIEQGFDPAITGFFSRVTELTAGTFVSVSHSMKDGSPVTGVRVYVRFVTDGAQVASHQFRPGDQLVKIGDVPVTNVYSWTFGGGFPGGLIEIQRDGALLRLEGFTAGSLGVILEERANPVR